MSHKADTIQQRANNSNRSRVDKVMWALCYGGLLTIVVPIVWIIYQVVARALPHISMSVFTTNTIGNGGGLRQAILGTLVLLIMVGTMAGVTGVGAGIYISQFAPKRVGGILRGAIEILAGVPSIVAGFVGYITLVIELHWSFSIWAASFVLAAIVVPYIAKTTEISLRGVPLAMRESGQALGLPDSLVLRKILLKSASPGIVTGLILALAISVGETAPLLYTAGWSTTNPTFSLSHSPVGYLTYPIWTFYDYPIKSASYLALESAMILIMLVIGLIVVSHVLRRILSKHLPE